MESILDIIKPIKLLEGSHSDTGETGSGCFMNVIAYLNGEPQITDESPCVCRSIRAVAIWANDAAQDDQTRQRLLPFIHRAMGTATDDPKILKPRVKHLLTLIVDLARQEKTDLARESAEAAAIGAENLDGAIKQIEYFGMQAVKLANMVRGSDSTAAFNRAIQFLDEALPAAVVPDDTLIRRANELLEAARIS